MRYWETMLPFLDIGPVHLGTFGLLLWLAAVCATYVLHRNFQRNGLSLDALNIVVFAVIAGILGAKLWHELQDPRELAAAWRQILLPGWSHPGEVVLGFFTWFKAGFAWFGGLLAGVGTLVAQGISLRPNGFRNGKAAMRMLDLATPAAALGYGVGRIGCLTSGDGDYGINTTLPWGVHMARNALVPPTPPDAAVQPTPVYELLYSAVIAWWLWRRGAKPAPLGYLTGMYLVLSGVGRFLVEFVRINPKLYFGHTLSNAQVAALGSVTAGGLLMAWSLRRSAGFTAPTATAPAEAQAAVTQ